ncbi:glycoside hydrolase family 88 protein [Maribellus mangrovi]|uniref:glycoside hydrolase family 88 protein n=1 Tax=Maribellus mangrovi TaxID=3133146 RepID=UPI0030EF427A
MKQNYINLLFILALVMGCTSVQKEQQTKLIDTCGKQLKFLVSGADQLSENHPNLTSPRTVAKSGDPKLVASSDWTSGFFPGELWYMYQLTGDSYWLSKAKEYTGLLEQEQFNGHDHDIGFRMYCSYGNGYRITNDSTYRNVLIQSARTLCSRFNEKVGCIKSWDNKKWTYPVIIDNMMNLELLFRAAKETGDTLFSHVAIRHAQTTLKNHFRKDYSSYHVVDYDTLSGRVLGKVTHQGFANESAWARGQAWGLYGYTMAYRETGMTEFLSQAQGIASFIMNHPHMPEDLVPYWDFNDPGIPDAPRDASAAAIIASALYELSGYVPDGKQFTTFADRIMKSLSSKSYLAETKTNGGFLLLHSTGNNPKNSEVDVPLVYADYYFLEALLRKNKLEEK